MQIDTSTEFGQRIERRLREESIIWFTTVRPDGQPIPVPVWFAWDAGTVLIYSQPNKPKLRNIMRHPQVSLNFNSDQGGGNVIQFDGEAMIDGETPPATGVPAMIQKYETTIINGLGMTPEGFASEYSVPIRVTLQKIRGH